MKVTKKRLLDFENISASYKTACLGCSPRSSHPPVDEVTLKNWSLDVLKLATQQSSGLVAELRRKKWLKQVSSFESVKMWTMVTKSKQTSWKWWEPNIESVLQPTCTLKWSRLCQPLCCVPHPKKSTFQLLRYLSFCMVPHSAQWPQAVFPQQKLRKPSQQC